MTIGAIKEVKLFKENGSWKLDDSGKVYDFAFFLDRSSSWISLGLLKDSAVQFTCNDRGILEEITHVKQQENLDVISIPKNHGLYQQLDYQKVA